MSTRRLRERAPTARALGAACLVGHRLAWHKIGRDGSGKCDAHFTGRADDVLWGVVFAIDFADRTALDAAEGLGQGYDLATVEIRLGGRVVEAGVYRATHIDRDLRPFDWYHALVIDGADEHGLPADYVTDLRRMVPVHDPDRARRLRHLSLLRRP